MNSDDVISEFGSSIEKSLNQFEQRLRQQQLFQVQNDLLKELQKKVKNIGFFNSEDIKVLSEQYQLFYEQLKESGRGYENIVAEKNLVDTYSAFEKFIADCYSSVYLFFPKFLGNEVSINTFDLFVNNDLEICKQNVVGSKVKSFVQANNIKIILTAFKNKPFNIKKLEITENDLNLLYEIGLIRNLVVHNNGIVNRIYIESIKSVKNKSYIFNQDDSVLTKLEDVVQDLKALSIRLSEYIAKILIDEARFLYERHQKA
jgi:hypothetical protein